MRAFFLIAMTFMLISCAGLEPETRTSEELNLGGSLVFSASANETIEAIKASFSDKDWKLLYEGEKYPVGVRSPMSNMSHNPFSGQSPESFDAIAMEKAMSSTMAPSYYIQAKTPTWAFSYGAELFVIVYERPESGTQLAISAASGQVLEKDKLELYIRELISLINEKID